MRTGWHCSSTISITNAEKVGNLLSPCLAWFSRTLVPYLEWAQLGRILTCFLLSFSLFNGPYPQLTAFLICKFLSSQQTPLKHFHPSMKSSIIVLTSRKAWTTTEGCPNRFSKTLCIRRRRKLIFFDNLSPSPRQIIKIKLCSRCHFIKNSLPVCRLHNKF